MSPAAAWRWCLAAGLVTMACAWGFGRIPGLVACGDTRGLGPILAFEVVQTPADVAALFGAEPCRSTLAEAQRFVLWLDAVLFIPAYTAFLCFAAWASVGRRRVFVMALLILAGALDQVEGALLFAVLRRLPGDQAVLDVLPWVVGAKFLLLTIGTGLVGVLLSESGRRVGMLAGGVIGATSIWAFFHGIPSMLTGFTVSWTTLLVVAAIGIVSPRLLVPRLPAPARPSG